MEVIAQCVRIEKGRDLLAHRLLNLLPQKLRCQFGERNRSRSDKAIIFAFVDADVQHFR